MKKYFNVQLSVLEVFLGNYSANFIGRSPIWGYWVGEAF